MMLGIPIACIKCDNDSFNCYSVFNDDGVECVIMKCNKCENEIEIVMRQELKLLQRRSD
jgi:hypothetical protein